MGRYTNLPEKIDVLLLLFYYMLFYMPYQAHVLGLSNLKENNFLENTYAEYTNSSLIACTIGLIAFMLAFNGSAKIKLNKNLKLLYSRLQYLNFYVILLLILLVLGVLFYFFGFAQFLSDEYSGSDTGNSTTDGIYFLLVLFFSIISGGHGAVLPDLQESECSDGDIPGYMHVVLCAAAHQLRPEQLFSDSHHSVRRLLYLYQKYLTGAHHGLYFCCAFYLPGDRGEPYS